MQIKSIISPPTQPIFRVQRSTSITRASPLNPLRKTVASLQTLEKPTITALKFDESIPTHLANLEKVLQKSSSPPLPDPSENESVVRVSSPEKRNRGLFDGLNLNGIWPGTKKVEEMSPRNLNKLKRLLSKTAEYSPRNHLGSRWEEYHGRNDWAGLLEPLNENLRREVVRYGEFVQGAYHTFHSNPATAQDSSPLSRQVSISDSTFRVTKSLYATSSVGLPGWINDIAPDLGWMTQQSSWIGYVAVCDNQREIERMGRRDIVISLRGTATCLEWAENARAALVPLLDTEPGRSQPKVECGFWSLYKTAGAHVPSLSEAVVEEVKRLINQYKGEQLSITVTGHSLGAALALLVADELSTCADNVPPIAVISFGGPRVGNKAFGARVSNNGVKVLRVVNTRDVITKVPGVFIGEGSDVLEETPLGYSHVGSELRLDSKKSPFLKPDADVACCHDLEAYLHLVDGFLGSECPFRENAKRPIRRLLNEQRSNMKKLYTNKVENLTLNLDRPVGVQTTLQTTPCLASP
ncbi:phospholipase A1-Ibeta2, chloroplastic-like [Aristolochia californica]|uniref:phospholipase A1-Ibeta2, chloroplastic-like n=1 Tax=Aristolochia californica TaxID=171875 RepID=UPI0035E16AED